MGRLVDCGLSYLSALYDERTALFPDTAYALDGRYGGTIYGQDRAIRYTVNTLLGLKAVQAHVPEHAFARRVSEMTESFLRQHRDRVTDWADRGLLVLLLCEIGDRAAATEALEVISKAAQDPAFLSGRHVQALSWMLWGAVAGIRLRLAGAKETADALASVMLGQLLHRDSGLPRYGLAAHRREFASFGGITYFLRSIYEYASALDDSKTLDVFRRGVSQMIAIQGPQGEWPWMTGVSSAQPLDFYPVYSVHQHSMAFLFLFPALEVGIPETENAIVKSYRWILGQNQFEQSMVVGEPFLIYRCIQRKGPLRKEMRYLRCVMQHAMRRAGSLCSNSRVELNKECRSYEIGWLVYAWAGRTDFPEFSGDVLT